MAVIQILGPLNRGVDMTGEPLALGAQKIRSAVNCALRNGVIGSRPRFVYHPLGFSGCFQGATGYAPAFGLSAQSFAPRSASIVTCTGGVLRRSAAQPGGRVSCMPEVIEAQDFGRNAVHLYQAENFLIAQSSGRNTHWWDGLGPATASPGMEPEAQWTDPSVPVTRICPALPVANLPECDKFPCDGGECSIAIENLLVTGSSTASFTITNTGTVNVTIPGFEPQLSAGQLIFDPPNMTLLAGTSQGVQVLATGLDLGVTQVTVNVPNSCGNLQFYVGGTSPVGECILGLVSVTGLTNTTAQVVIQNAGDTDIPAVNIVSNDSHAWLFTPSPTYALAAGATLEVLIDGLGSSLGNEQFTVSSNCGASVGATIPVTSDPVECELAVTGQTMIFDDHGTITIKNVGPSTVEGITIIPNNGNPWVFDPEMPAILDPGEEVTFDVTCPGFDMRINGYVIVSDCAPTLVGTTPNYP